jgi:predicted nucleotidyltransferase
VTIVIFGSTAIGADEPYSDLDVTVVTPKNLENRSQRNIPVVAIAAPRAKNPVSKPTARIAVQTDQR